MLSVRDVLGLVVAIAVCFAIAWVGSRSSSAALPEWYGQLAKPSWTPPSWLFGPVWTVLYLSMAVAVWLVWRDRGLTGAPVAMALFVGQLVLNAAWSAIFFGLRMPGAAFVEIVALWLAILGTAWAFWRQVPAAGWLLVPYQAWVTFAAALNFAIWRLNA